MLQRWCWGTLLLLASAAWAVTPGMTVLPTAATDGKPYAAHFAVGLSTDGGKTWQGTATLNQQATIKASIDPDATHVGKQGDLFVVELIGSQYSMLTTTGAWQPWSGNIADLKPAVDDAVLVASQELPIYSGPMNVSGQHQLFVGYMPANSTTIIYSGSPASFTVKMDPFSYFDKEVFQPIVMTTCTLCHVVGGAADASGLHFVRDSSKSKENYDIFTKFYAGKANAYDYVLGKVSGNAHGGGQPLPAGGTDYNKFAGFLDLLEGGSLSVGASQALFAGVENQSTIATLRDATLLLAGRLPTSDEVALAATGDTAKLKTALLAAMQGKTFHDFIKEGANDRLLLRGNEDFNLADDCPTCFPAMNAEYWRLKDIADQSGLATDRALVTAYMGQLNFSILESPLELIAYVVEQDKPYSEILTADYDLLTPVLNAAVGGTAAFSTSGIAEFKPGKVQGYYWRDPGTVVQQVVGAALPKITTVSKLKVNYPHSGVLNSKSFLSRYPSTSTNRNRARARWAYMHFLGVDIEALAQRTTDPVALADTNNPTMNNPACIVCHSVLDPVAGTFQDYNDSGLYRSALNGTDSLDRFYKASTTYKAGDTWYRDMRSPGFEGKAATGNTMQWLAQQIVADVRFASATVKFWWPAIMGAELLTAPEVTTDQNYQARLQAYEAQQTEIARLATAFTQSGLKLKELLAEMLLSPWYRAEKAVSAVDAVTNSARELAPLTDEKLLTPEQLTQKTKALTGFSWNTLPTGATGNMVSGLEGDYNGYYGGIDGFANKVRARLLTPLMSNVAAAHALESSCPIVLGDFIRPDAQRLLFSGLSPWLTPQTVATTTQTITSVNDTDFKTFSFDVDMPAGSYQLVLSHLNDACDYSSSASTCKADKNLVIDSLSIKRPDGATVSVLGSAGTLQTCAAVTNSTRATLYSSCTASYPFAVDGAGRYSISVKVAAKQSASDPVLASFNVESTQNAATATTIGAAAIKNKLVEIYGKLLGQQVSVTSPEVLASYDLLVQTWLSRKASNSAPSLFNKTLSCDWATDLGFIGTLNYPGSPLQTPTRYKSEVTTWLTPHAQDTLLMKQSWVVVMAYLLSHYDYLHE